MMHLSREHLVEFVEDPAGSSLPAERRRHVEGCETCRREAAALRAVLHDVSGEPGGEPSPLFWDHFSARVAEAIRDEAPVQAVRVWAFAGQRAAWTAVALTIVLGSTMVAWRATLHAPTVHLAGVEDSPRQDDLENDLARKIRSAADGWQWDDVQSAGMGAHPGAAEGVVMELTPDERAELARLIETDMRRNGA